MRTMTGTVPKNSVARPPAEAEPLPDAKRQTLVEHLEELRRRLWVCVISLLLFSIGGYFLAPRVIQWLKEPAGPFLPALAFFSPAEALMAHLKVALGVGACVSVPIFLYELWNFIRPGLTARERVMGFSFVVWGTLLFATGVVFAYWGLLPVSLRFLLTFGEGTLTPVISISHYLSFTAAVVLSCGVLFELPVLVFFLTRLGILSPKLLREKWRVAFLGIVTAAALLTPTQDVLTLLLMALPLLGLYGVSILVATVAVPETKRPQPLQNK